MKITKSNIVLGVLFALACQSPPTADPSDGGPPAGDASVTQSGPACATLPFATACTLAATSAPPSGSFGTMGAMQVTVETLPNPHATAPGPISVYRPTGQTAVPVLFFSHAFGATDAKSYEPWFQSLASNGYAVVQVPYPDIPPVQQKNADRYQCLWDGFLAAVGKYGTTFDLTRVGFFGHSFGGGATPEMARRGVVEKGWGSAGRFMFIMAPWYSWGTGYDTLPTDLRTVVQVYADDNKNDHLIAVNEIWNKLPAGIERSWIMLRSDSCECGLNASHVVPISASPMIANPESVTNGYDVWGVWRRVAALAAYSLRGDASARAVAYGTDTAMGSWLGCGGRAVRPLESSTTTPITSTCQPLMYPEASRCTSADPGVTCP